MCDCPETFYHCCRKTTPSLQDELMHVKEVLDPKKPFLAIVAGSKYDTKIGPLTAMYQRVDKIILGGVMYNTYLCAKYGIKIAGVEVLQNSKSHS